MLILNQCHHSFFSREPMKLSAMPTQNDKAAIFDIA